VRRLALTAVFLGAIACGREAEPPPRGSPRGQTTPPVTSTATTVRQWVAVFDTAGHPDNLDPSTEVLLDAVGGNVAVQPVQCWEGLAEDLEVGAGEYAAAVIATSAEELNRLVDRVGEEPIGTGRYQAFCLD
jgi:hypothetical protein